MNDLEQQTLQTYQKNLDFFKVNIPLIFEKITIFSHALSQGIYIEKYALEYKDEGYFDIQEIFTKEFLYGENSQKYSEKLSSIVNCHRTGSVFEAQQRFNIKEEELEEIGDFKNFQSSLWATAKILYYNSKVSPKSSSEMEKIYKFIFLETGLGLHIPIIIKRYKIPSVFIYEQNIELFRLSLFVTDYAELSKNTKFFFSIMDTFEQLQYTFTSFLNDSFNHNLYIKFLPFSKNHQEILHDLQSITLSQNHIMYPYQAYMARSFNAIDKISQGKCFFDISHTYDKTPLSSKPILVLASGPSLQNNTEWIKQNQEKFLIIAVLSACQHLFHHNITPDIIVHIDPQEVSLHLIENIEISKFQNSTIIFGSSVHHKVVEKFKDIPIIFIEEATSFKINHGFYTLPSIGEYATMLPLIMGAKEVFVLGVDLALDPESMKDHIDLHVASKQINKENKKESVSFQGSLCYVKGNFLDTVPSKPNFRLSLTQFHKAVLHYKQAHQTIYNLSNGAYLEGTIPLHVTSLNQDSLPSIDKPLLHSKISTFLHAHSSCEFRDIDQKNIEKQLENSIHILNTIKKLRFIASKEPENYLFKKLIPFVQESSEMHTKHKSDLGEILFEYFKITLSFIFDTFNTKNLKDTKKHIKELDKIVLDELEKIVLTYHNTLEKALKKG